MDEAGKADLTFEQALRQLEETVRKLESGDLPLGDSIEQYKQSMRLVQFCRQQLDKAEFELRQLTEGDQTVSLKTESEGN